MHVPSTKLISNSYLQVNEEEVVSKPDEAEKDTPVKENEAPLNDQDSNLSVSDDIQSTKKDNEITEPAMQQSDDQQPDIKEEAGVTNAAFESGYIITGFRLTRSFTCENSVI